MNTNINFINIGERTNVTGSAMFKKLIMSEQYEEAVAVAKSQIDKAQAVINHAKWTAATAWCKQQGMGFRVITENQIFNRPKNSKKRKK